MPRGGAARFEIDSRTGVAGRGLEPSGPWQAKVGEVYGGSALAASKGRSPLPQGLAELCGFVWGLMAACGSALGNPRILE